MNKSILIVEDEPFIVESLTFLLERDGQRVRSVGDGEEALASIARERPDLVVLDAMIPGANGFDVLARLRADARHADLPVLVLTAKGQPADREKMMALGANDFMTKPFSNQELLLRIRDLLTAAKGSE